MIVRLTLIAAVFVQLLQAQSTQSVLAGRITDSVSGQPVSNASVECVSDTTHQLLLVPVDSQGFYAIPSLSTGTYIVTVRAPDYQAQQARALQLLVASRVELNIKLRPLSDLWEAGQLHSWQSPETHQTLPFYGPDLDGSRIVVFDPNQRLNGLSSLQSGVSYVIDPLQLDTLPLSGQNVYQLLTFQPGVSSVLTVNGQRSALFLVDGIEGAPAFGPEFIQEYRVSTGNYSAEFGRTTGFIANAITRSGSSRFHALLYSYINNEVLNANAFQSNFYGFPRQRHRELRNGFWSGGPLVRDKTFFSLGYENFRSRTREYPFTFQVPVLASFRACPSTQLSQGTALLARFLPPAVPTPSGDPCTHLSAPYSFTIPIAIDRGLSLARLDQLMRGGKDHLSLRGIANLETDPDANFSLYKDFTSAYKGDTTSLAFDASDTLTANITNDFRAGWTRTIGSLPRPHPEIPGLTTISDGVTFYSSNVIVLPGVSAATGTARNRNDTLQFANTTTISLPGHLLSFGAGALVSTGNSLSAYDQSGEYQFDSLLTFGQDQARFLMLPLSRQSIAQNLLNPDAPLSQPGFTQSESRVQSSVFAQDSFRLTRRLAINLGLRYDYFGVPKESSAGDAWIQLGSQLGPTETGIQDALRTARFQFGPGCCRPSYNPDLRDWQPRIGVAWDITGAGKHAFRAAWGRFYDSPPGASTYGNTFEQATFDSSTGHMTVDYSRPSLSQPHSFVQGDPSSPQPVLFSPQLDAAVVRTWYAGVQDLWSSRLATELSYAGSSGKKLLTADLVNRTDATLLDSARLNATLPDTTYFSDSGYSRYNAFTALFRYRSRPLVLQASFTLSHSLDNGGGYFTRQFDTELDRGNSDFDQRHNLVVYAIAETPSHWIKTLPRSVTQGWKLGALMGFRSGFPYSVYASDELKACNPNAPAGAGPALYQNRASLVPGVAPELAQTAVPGGVVILNEAAFCRPAQNVPGTLGRNSFIGPGFWNIDTSLAKSFPLKWPGDSSALQLRANFFNTFNHANLGNPLVGTAAFGQFGQAFYGKAAAPPGNVSFVPLDETPRRIELQLRLLF